jgi:hypothetical protein
MSIITTSLHLFIIYMSSQQLQGQLQAQRSVDLRSHYGQTQHKDTSHIIIIIIIQFNSIHLIYYRANLTARRPITKRAREENRNKNTHIQNITQGHFDDK